MKIYTGGGDRGRTSLFSGERIAKDDVRVEAYGDVDELNSLLGAVLSTLPNECRDRIRELHQIQSDLFRVGACLATSGEDPSFDTTRDLPLENTRFLEQAIDRMDEQLPRLSQFILPGGHPAACWSHVARCVCRRAERHTVRTVRQASGDGEMYSGTLTYLNRLSDYLFMLARYCNQVTQTPDTPLGERMTSQNAHTSDNRHTSRIIHRRWLTEDTFTLTLERPPDFHFRAGQRIRLISDGKTRDYSLIPGDRHDHLTLLIRSVADGVVSPHLNRCPLGSALDFTGPSGHFIYRPSSRPAIFIATGTGIAPFAAMGRSGMEGFVLLHGVRTVEDLYFREDLEPAAERYIPCISCRTASTPHEAYIGRVTQYVQNHFPEGEYDFYLAGRREMIAEVFDIVDHRFPSSRVYSEIFF